MIDVLKSYILQNWILVLILGAFLIVLSTAVFLNKKSTFRMFILILLVFVLSIVVFAEFYITPSTDNALARKILMSIRYSATPFIVALVIYALIKQLKAFIFIPASVLLIIDIVSIFTGIVFDIGSNGLLVRGPLWIFPYLFAGLYMAFLVYILIRRSNKRAMEIIPIVFLSLALLSGLVFPFVFGAAFSQIFCSIIAVALFIYYVFSILQLSRKDPLTGLLNRQAYYAEMDHNGKDVTAIISIDMNGLKEINDKQGHAEGDKALVTLGICFLKECKPKQTAYRIGGDEFLIVCLKTQLEEVKDLVERISKGIEKTNYNCAIGYSYNEDGKKTVNQLLKESDEAMYSMKETYYESLK